MAFPLAALAKLIFGGGGQAASGAAAAAPTFVGAAGGAAGGGATAGLTKVAEGSMMSKLLSMGKSALQNPQVQQILSATGANLAGPGSLAESWNDITQQRIATQSYAKVLSKILNGEIEGGKFEISDKGTKIQFPNQKGGTSELGSVGDTSGLGVEGTPNAGMFKVANPFSPSQSGISAADLTGLTPQDISSAFQDTLSVEALKQKRVRDVIDMIYKFNKMQNTDTAAIKNYKYAVRDGYTGSFEEFQRDSKTTHQKDYEEAVAGGYEGSFNEWLLQMRRAGATRISLGEKLTEKKAIGELKGQLYFKDPKSSSDLAKYISSEDVQNKIFASDDPDLARAEESVKFIEGKITAGGGTIEDVKLSEDGKTMIWTVKWPSGDTETIERAIRN